MNSIAGLIKELLKMVSMPMVLSMVLISAFASQLSAKTWSLENTPQQYRPGFCEGLRKQIIYDRTTQTYRWAMKRKAEGAVTRKSKARLDYSASLIDSMQRLKCPNIP